MSNTMRIDWRRLSGPRVSRRTLLELAGAAGAMAALSGSFVAGPRMASATALQEPKTGGTLRLGFNISQIVTLDPGLLSQGVVAGSILPSLHSSLVQFDEQLGLIPDLAEDWTVSEDGLTYSFTLREGIHSTTATRLHRLISPIPSSERRTRILHHPMRTSSHRSSISRRPTSAPSR
jgi:hypothetical protein